MKKGPLAALVGILCLLPFASAQAGLDEYGWIPGSTHPVVDAGLSGGGDKLVTVQFTNGDTSSIYAGNGFFGDFGVQHNFADTDWAFKATLGFDYDAVNASNGTIRFNRYPLDLLALYSIGDNHIGFGVTEHFTPHLDLDGFGPNGDFDNATGVMLQYQYWLFGVRATSIHYKVSSGCTSDCNINGSSLSLFFNYVF